MMIDVTAFVENTVYEKISAMDFAMQELSKVTPVARRKEDLSDLYFKLPLPLATPSDYVLEFKFQTPEDVLILRKSITIQNEFNPNKIASTYMRSLLRSTDPLDILLYADALGYYADKLQDRLVTNNASLTNVTKLYWSDQFYRDIMPLKVGCPDYFCLQKDACKELGFT